MSYNLKYSQYNERSILIEWPAIIDENILNSVLNFKICIQKKYIKLKVEVIHTYSSILIIYDFTIDNVNDRILTLKRLFEDQIPKAGNVSRTWEIPVCYDNEYGTDLEYLCSEKKYSKSEIIQLHSEPIYTVYFIGFLPGFLYLGGLDKELFLDRKTTPNLNVKKGSVAIGGQQTGIYPQDSPGGWHVIGKTPIELFQITHNPPCLINAGDKLKFKPIDRQEYLEIENQISRLSFQLKPITPNA